MIIMMLLLKLRKNGLSLPPKEEEVPCGCAEMELNFFWKDEQL